MLSFLSRECRIVLPSWCYWKFVCRLLLHTSVCLCVCVRTTIYTCRTVLCVQNSEVSCGKCGGIRWRRWHTTVFRECNRTPVHPHETVIVFVYCTNCSQYSVHCKHTHSHTQLAFVYWRSIVYPSCFQWYASAHEISIYEFYAHHETYTYTAHNIAPLYMHKHITVIFPHSLSFIVARVLILCVVFCFSFIRSDGQPNAHKTIPTSQWREEQEQQRGKTKEKNSDDGTWKYLWIHVNCEKAWWEHVGKCFLFRFCISVRHRKTQTQRERENERVGEGTYLHTIWLCNVYFDRIVYFNTHSQPPTLPSQSTM